MLKHLLKSLLVLSHLFMIALYAIIIGMSRKILNMRLRGVSARRRNALTIYVVAPALPYNDFIREYDRGMPFSEEIVRAAWEGSGQRCECQRKSHDHRNGRCGQSLRWSLRRSVASAGWEAHRRMTCGIDVLANWESLCAGC